MWYFVCSWGSSAGHLEVLVVCTDVVAAAYRPVNGFGRARLQTQRDGIRLPEFVCTVGVPTSTLVAESPRGVGSYLQKMICSHKIAVMWPRQFTTCAQCFAG